VSRLPPAIRYALGVRLRLTLPLIVMCACAHPLPPAVSPAPPEDGCIPDPADECPAFEKGCSPTAEEIDGCPTYLLVLDADCRAETATMAKVAREVSREPRLTRLRIVTTEARCGQAVADALVRAGVTSSKLELAASATSASSDTHRNASFEVAAWDGTDCR
jgi:hypothetical protein